MASENGHRRFFSRFLRIGLAAVLLLLLLAIALAIWAVGSQKGAQVVLSYLANATSGAVKVEAVQGRLAGPLTIGSITVVSDSDRITLHDVQLDWKPQALLHAELHLTSLQVAQMSVSHKMQQKPSTPHLPGRIGLPLAVQADHVQIDESKIDWGPLNIVHLGTVAFQLDYDRSRYRLRLAQLSAHSTIDAGTTISGGLNGEATLATASPYALQAQFASNGIADLQHQTVHVKSRIEMNGTLRELTMAVAMTANDAHANGNAVLRPFSQDMLGDVDLRLHDFDLAALRSTLPHTSLNAALSITHGTGELELKNNDAGLYNAGKLPIKEVHAAFRQHAGKLEISKLQATLGTPKHEAGSINGNGQYVNGAMNLHLDLKAVDLRQLDQRMQATKLSGPVDIVHMADKQELNAELSEPFGEKKIALSAHAEVSDNRIEIKHADVTLGSGDLHTSGQLNLTGQNAFDAEGKMHHFRLQELGHFDAMPDIELNGKFSLHGARQPKLTADLAFDLNGSRIEGRALQGEGQASLRADRLSVPKLLLAVGDNHLQASGELSGGDAQLRFDLEAPQLAQLDSSLGGALQARGSAHGSFDEPHIDAAWTVTKLRLPSQLQVEQTGGKATIIVSRTQPFHFKTVSMDATASGIDAAGKQLANLKTQLQFSPQADAPLKLNVQGDDAKTSSLQIDHFSIKAHGTTARHTITAFLSEPGQNWTVDADGGLHNLDAAVSWQGRITRVDGDGDITGHLVAAAPLSVSRQQVKLDRFVFDTNAGHITIEHLLREQKRIVTSGSFDRLELMPFLQFSTKQPALSSDLQMGGEWKLDIADTVTGSLKLYRQRGDIVMKGSTPVTLGLQNLQGTAQAANGHLTLHFAADGEEVGHINVNGTARLGSGEDRFLIVPDAPLSATARVDIPSLAWAGSLISPTLLTGGRLQSTVSVSGTYASPRLAGNISADALRLLFIEQGVDLRHGVLKGEFRNDELIMHELRFQSVDGDAVVSGPISWTDGKASAHLALNAERFVLFNRVDRRLVVSGQSSIDWNDNNLQGGITSKAKIVGAFHVDSGFFDLGRGDTPQLSDDVVIVGRTQKQAARTLSDIDIKVALGEGIKLQGRGLDATLAGQIRVVSGANGTLQGEGTLNISKGTYSAYGHKLAIERGELLFHGPIGNPALDILAMQRAQNLEVETGVAVSGTVQSPRITLVSEPSVPDTEKLSWLVLGHGLDTAGSSDLGVLQAAASALLSRGGSSGMQSQLANAFGLDEINVTTDQNNAQQRVVTLGKKLSSKLEVGYEQGIESASSVLHLRYTLSKHLSLEGEAGTRSAISMFFNFLID